MADRIADPWGAHALRTRCGLAGPGRRPARRGLTEDDADRWAQSASLLHSNGDAMDIAVKDERIVGVRGRAADRVNRGRLGPKDLYGWQANNSADRLTRPLVRDGGRLVETDWDTAMGRIVARSRELLDGPGGWGRFGFYTSGQLFLEEYYALALIGKAGIGTPHMDGNTRLCTATAASSLKATEFFVRADMRDTKVGAGKKDDQAKVARQGYEALMAGDDHVVAGSVKNRG